MIFLLATLLWSAFAQDLSQEGARAMREKRFADAERIYRQLIQQVPNEPRLRMNLALALHSGAKYKEAIPEFQSFLKAVPQPGPAHLLLGLSYLKLNQSCPAIAPLEQARQWQASVQVLTELGDAYNGCKRYLLAAQTYQQAAKLQKAPDPRLLRITARAFWQGRDYASARPIFQGIEPKYQNEPEFHYEYGDTLARIDGAQSAIPYLRKAVAAAPNLIAARGALGRALFDSGKAGEAIPHLEAAAPSDASLLLPLSRAYKAAGREADAAKAQAEYRRRAAELQ